jgi:phosphatidylserine/phosphatidylglycerophosphate/cardiolipin synthase-like enzyme
VDGARIKPWFTPGHGEALSARVGKRIGQAKKVRICSPVITAAPVLATLAQVIADGTTDVAGCVDATQVEDVIRQWHANGNVAWKLPLLQQIIEGPFTGKQSEPWQLGSLHNFMHAKVVVADETVFVGSFNLSHSGEKNAENVLEIRDAGLAESLAAYVDEVRERYPAITPTRSSKAASR